MGSCQRYLWPALFIGMAVLLTALMGAGETQPSGASIDARRASTAAPTFDIQYITSKLPMVAAYISSSIGKLQDAIAPAWSQAVQHILYGFHILGKLSASIGSELWKAATLANAVGADTYKIVSSASAATAAIITDVAAVGPTALLVLFVISTAYTGQHFTVAAFQLLVAKRADAAERQARQLRLPQLPAGFKALFDNPILLPLITAKDVDGLIAAFSSNVVYWEEVLRLPFLGVDTIYNGAANMQENSKKTALAIACMLLYHMRQQDIQHIRTAMQPLIHGRRSPAWKTANNKVYTSYNALQTVTNPINEATALCHMNTSAPMAQFKYTKVAALLILARTLNAMPTAG